jgi:hypothetical protein
MEMDFPSCLTQFASSVNQTVSFGIQTMKRRFVMILPIALVLASAQLVGAAEQAVRKAAQEFDAAFNSGSADKIAALWTADAEYVDEDGRQVQGRRAQNHSSKAGRRHDGQVEPSKVMSEALRNAAIRAAYLATTNGTIEARLLGSHGDAVEQQGREVAIDDRSMKPGFVSCCCCMTMVGERERFRDLAHATCRDDIQDNVPVSFAQIDYQ